MVDEQQVKEYLFEDILPYLFHLLRIFLFLGRV